MEGLVSHGKGSVTCAISYLDTVSRSVSLSCSLAFREDSEEIKKVCSRLRRSSVNDDYPQLLSGEEESECETGRYSVFLGDFFTLTSSSANLLKSTDCAWKDWERQTKN